MGFLSRRFRRWFSRGNQDDSQRLEDYEVNDTVLRSKEFQKRTITYKDTAIQALVQKFPLYDPASNYELGSPVRLSNGAAAMMAFSETAGRAVPIFISPYKNREWIESFIAKIGNVADHQRLLAIKWPERGDAEFQPKLQKIFAGLGYLPDKAKFDPKACDKFGKRSGEAVRLKWYQKCPGAYLVYSKQRGMLVFHGTGTGKTCMAAQAIENFIKFTKVEETMRRDSTQRAHIKPKVFVVLPPKKSLDENMRDELANSCPTLIKELVDKSRGKAMKVDMANRIINKYVTIISYISLAHRLKKGTETLDNSILLMDEAHNFLESKTQYAKEYKFLYERVRATKACKVMLMTATPIYKSLSDLSKLLNVIRLDSEAKLPETDAEFLKQYFDGNTLNKQKFMRDVMGNVSYVNLENDLSVFAEKVVMNPIVTHVSDDHYSKWLESKKVDDRRYGLSETTTVQDLVFKDNKAFKNRETGYFKHSSGVNNTPLAYRAHNKWPAKFGVVGDLLAKYPKSKIFIYSRHKAQGANAIGLFLENELGWDRMSNNRQDHGANAPRYFNPLAKELGQIIPGKIENSESNTRQASQALIRQHVKKPYKGFIVLNNGTSRNESKRSLRLFNDAHNKDGNACRVFIGDEAYGEGVSLMACSVVICLEPPYSFQNFQQIVARAVRHCSHQSLPRPWKVDVYTLVSNKDEQHFMTDELLVKFSEENQNILQQVINSVREGSIEYGFDTNAGKYGMTHTSGFGVWKGLLKMLHTRFR